VTEVPVPEGDEDAVRIMTVHAAKGLEFPVVILTGLNADRPARTDGVLFDREGNKAEVSIGQGRSFTTPGFEGLADNERRMGEDEYVRLLYVATTRARDHLVLSVFRTEKDEKSAAAQMGKFLDGEDDLWEQVPEHVGNPSKYAEPEKKVVEPEGHSLESRDEWISRRKLLLEKQGRPMSVAATRLAQIAKEESQSEEPWKRGRGGTSIGRAVHSVLQTIDLVTGGGIEATSHAQAAAEGIPDRSEEIASLVRVAVESDVVRRAVASGRLWREVPVAVPMGEGVLEGFIDLLFEEEGSLIVVDYKTDALEATETGDAVDRYRLKAGSYALAVQNATGKAVQEVVFLFLQPRREETLTNINELVEEAEDAAVAHLG